MIILAYPRAPKAKTDVYWTPDIPTTTDNLVTFNPVPKSGNVISYNWMFTGTGVTSGYDTSALKNPQRKYEETGKYPVMLIPTTDWGCMDTTGTCPFPHILRCGFFRAEVS